MQVLANAVLPGRRFVLHSHGHTKLQLTPQGGHAVCYSMVHSLWV
jgi:hypothetical protein